MRFFSYIYFSVITLILLIPGCKKKETKKLHTTVTFYRNCNDVAANATYYIVELPSYGYNTPDPIPFTTDANGVYVFESEKHLKKSFTISTDKNYDNLFYSFKSDFDENINLGIARESAANHLILKLKTNHALTNQDTIRYVFQYGNDRAPIYGPILRDTILSSFTFNINPNSYNANPSAGEDKLLWWGLNKSTVGSNDNQVNFKIHGCVGTADTAYIIIP